MYGCFALLMTPTDLAEVFGTCNAVPNFMPIWNLPPSQPTPVVRHNPKIGERRLDMLRWRAREVFVMAASDLISLSGLIDDAKCFALVSQHRWLEGACCPNG